MIHFGHWIPSGHMALEQRQNLDWNNVMTSFHLNFDVVPRSCARWVQLPFCTFFYHIYQVHVYVQSFSTSIVSMFIFLSPTSID